MAAINGRNEKKSRISTRPRARLARGDVSPTAAPNVTFAVPALTVRLRGVPSELTVVLPAAVNETVTLAHQLAPRASGFINAVLRQADRRRDAIPYPDRGGDPAGYLAARHSHPRWLADLWCRQLGPEEAESLASAMSAAMTFGIPLAT